MSEELEEVDRCGYAKEHDEDDRSRERRGVVVSAFSLVFLESLASRQARSTGTGYQAGNISDSMFDAVSEGRHRGE